jgi:hypothetical protein
MSGKTEVRILIGTRKGAFILDGDTNRKKWVVRGPYHPGRDVFQVKADPRTPGMIYAAVNSGWWGPMMFRSSDWGKKWTEISVPQMVRSRERPPPSGPDAPEYPVKNVWQIAPGLESEPNSLLLGIDPASLWRTDDRGMTWEPIPGLNDHETRPKWNPGAGGMCLHTILRDPQQPKRLYVGISAAGAFRSEDDGAHWTPINKGVVISFQPDTRPIVGQCIHKMTFEPSNSSTLYRMDHDGIFVTHDRGEKWVRMGRSLPYDFGFVVATAPARPNGAYYVPVDPTSRLMLDGNQVQVYRWNDLTRKFSPMIPRGAFPGAEGTHREGLATDNLDPPGIYLGTNGGHVYWTADGGKKWSAVPFQFPGIHSVTVAGPSPAG